MPTKPVLTATMCVLVLAVLGCREDRVARGSNERQDRVEPTATADSPADRATTSTAATPDELIPLDQVSVSADEVLDVRGLEMMLDPEDTVISRVIKRDRIWEPLETELIERELRPGDVVVDAGANIGYYTLLAARKVGPQGHVYAFEPEPRAYEILKRNVALNHLDNVTLFPKALGRAPGTLSLYLARRNRGDHRMYDPSGKRESVEVEVVRLDDVLSERGVTQVDFIKIDTQGAECAILDGSGDLVRASRELAIVLEFTPSALRALGDDPRACIERLVTSGFSLVDIREWERRLVPTDPESLSTLYPEDGKQFTNIFLPRRDVG